MASRRSTLAKPHIHSRSSAKKFGGKWEDYLDIHEFMDSSKGGIADYRHRALAHNSWFIMTVLPRVCSFSYGEVSVNGVGEDEVDYPSPPLYQAVNEWLDETGEARELAFGDADESITITRGGKVSKDSYDCSY